MVCIDCWVSGYINMHPWETVIWYPNNQLSRWAALQVDNVIYLFGTQIINFTESRVGNPTFLLPPLSFALNAASFFPPTHLPSGHRFAISGHLTTHCTLLSASAPSSASSLLAFTRRVERRDSQSIPSFFFSRLNDGLVHNLSSSLSGFSGKSETFDCSFVFRKHILTVPRIQPNVAGTSA